ncbi:APC family permease [Winogradskya humida]|uniref:Amino acid permease n=1 Tax=Winogradskya humida TaxID=113566 RepID=A0ABQ3ZQ65_9ACTN|nr:amino acid permease [Actinoplanes humidus]GIE20725.1 amino acid permease [Actinoplanes humidus]
MSITASRGVALYVGALLGPGLLVLPGLAAAQAGPASIIAWIGLLLLSGLIAIVFATLGVTRPSAGGVAEYARLGLGDRAARAVRWLFLAGITTGAPLACYMGAGYLGGTRITTAIASAVLLLVVLAVTRHGVRTSTTMQLVLVGLLLAVILLAVAGAAPHSRAANWTPFTPHGWSSIGPAATVLMFSFVGWEAIASLTGRFTNPRRDLPRVIAVAFAITTTIYLALAYVTVAALGDTAGTATPIAALLELGIGAAGPAVAAVSAVILTLGTVNAYLTGGMQMVARPNRFTIAILVTEAALLTLLGTGTISTTVAVTVPTACFLLVYLLCMLSAIRSLPGLTRPVAAVVAVAVTVVLSFGGYAVVPALLVTVAAFALPLRPMSALSNEVPVAESVDAATRLTP